VADLQSGYNITEKVGTGAKSTIYKVVDPRTGKTFALKKVVRDEGEDERFLQQACNEHEIASQTNHPVLRQSIDIHRIKKLLGFRLQEVHVLMEYVQGVSLEQHRPTDMLEIVHIFLRVAEGLDALHKMNYLHADLKPNNILVTMDNEVKVIDFGQGCPIGHRKRRIQGTPGYIAPEQVDRKTLSVRTDVFNFGATLYWVLTNRTIPTDIDKSASGASINLGGSRSVPIPTPQELNEAVPPNLSRLVMESIRKNPADRPRDMKQIITRLEAVHHLLKRREGPAEPPPDVSLDDPDDPDLDDTRFGDPTTPIIQGEP
jgi:serine/threonine-protein kinase